MSWIDQAVSPADAVRAISSGTSVFIHGAAATPTPLIDALAAREDLEGVTAYHLHLEGRVAIAEYGAGGRFRPTSLFTGASLRQAVNEGRADFVPVFPAATCTGSSPSTARPTSGASRSANAPTP
jgi:acyl-CoA hydrolase